MPGALDLMAAALRPESLRRALRVTGVVAPVLIVVNHLPCALDHGLAPRCFLQAALTAAVPFCVSAYSSARAYLEVPPRGGHGD